MWMAVGMTTAMMRAIKMPWFVASDTVYRVKMPGGSYFSIASGSPVVPSVDFKNAVWTKKDGCGKWHLALTGEELWPRCLTNSKGMFSVRCDLPQEDEVCDRCRRRFTRLMNSDKS